LEGEERLDQCWVRRVEFDGWTKKPQGLTGPQIGSLLQQERKERKGNEAVAAGEQNQMLAVWS
jgi:hypothetical protein